MAILASRPPETWTSGPIGNARRDRGRAAAVRDERDDDAAAVRRPVDAAENGVDDGRRQGLGRAGRDVDHPELDAAVDVAEEGDRPPVGRPGGEGELDTRRAGRPCAPGPSSCP